MDLQKMTKLDLLELRMKVNQEIEVYENRNKTKVYMLYIFVESLGFCSVFGLWI